MKKTLNIFKYVLVCLVSVFLIFNIWTLFSKNILKQDMPKIFGFTSAIVGSGSMSPSFDEGDYVFIKEKDNYAVGDVICFKDGNEYITHRIIQIENNKFITKGDANNVNDKEPILQESVVGEVVSVWANFGHVIRFFHSIWGILILFVFGLFLILLEPIIVYIQSKKREVKNESQV